MKNEKFYVDTYCNRPVSGQVSTVDQYLRATINQPDFCGTWHEFNSLKEAEEFIAYLNTTKNQ